MVPHSPSMGWRLTRLTDSNEDQEKKQEKKLAPAPPHWHKMGQRTPPVDFSVSVL